MTPARAPLQRPKVLVATDGSDLALEAARRADTLLPSEREVIVLSVVLPPAVIVPSAVGAVFDPPDLGERLEGTAQEAAEADVDRTTQVLGAERSIKLVVEGDPGAEICRVAAEQNVDVIVVGSHGTGMLKRVLLGSVSHHVLHHAPCPVLVVRQPDGE